ncbi:MAG: FtsQ-type POTRA domain-containing protein [Candidatus Cloacimonetes bacterium]|nr:FtsQ-type POTRA domain-containing protein [Candidatus Cloacimonadota bacterium]MCF7814126.1 FtsQ-type POTRA domain-containing protein [Candidatus Cloacimonadota bacterium]MCF7868725.1 FtsQ-type POTRA domain-containing protein [Candidatus Cloacimonadota bacterium]MCF7884125.1 FtsQ-type POTRA domain-containing protein [Candidatus Cloacimonadota bacterium]
MSRIKTGSSRYFVFFFLVLCLLVIIFFSIRGLLSKVDWFRIESISIEGNKNLETEFLSNLSLDFLDSNLYAVSKEDIMKKYSNIIRIKDIKIRKIFPNKIKIEIQERKGLFNIKTTEGSIFPIDKEKIILDNDNFYSDEVLPVICTELSNENIKTGNIAEDAFLDRVYDFYNNVVPEFPEFFQQVSEFFPKDNEIYIVEANTGYKIVFGDEEIIDKVKRYEFLEQNRTFEKGKVVDLRYKDQLVIRADE